MARIRSVKPEICTSETMASCSAEVERTFVRLWTHCDDDGRAVDNVKLVKAALFPLHDDVTTDVLDGHLSELAAKGVIVRYVVDGKRYLACTSWAEHQHPQRPRDSLCPPPPEATDLHVSDESATPRVHVPDGSGPVVVVGEVVGEVGEQEASSALVPAESAPAVPVSQYHPAFETWWGLYPRKVGKAAAQAAWIKAKRKVGAGTLEAAVRSHAQAWGEARTELQFIPHPSTWLNEGRYDDPPPQRSVKVNATDEKVRALLAGGKS